MLTCCRRSDVAHSDIGLKALEETVKRVRIEHGTRPRSLTFDAETDILISLEKRKTEPRWGTSALDVALPVLWRKAEEHVNGMAGRPEGGRARGAAPVGLSRRRRT